MRGYTIYRKDRVKSAIASGGVAILIKNSIAAKQINLTTNLEAVAITTIVPNFQKITICNIYLPQNHPFTITQIESLIQQLPSPFIITGDVNSYNPLWGSDDIDSRGRKIEKIINDGIILLNDQSHTHFCSRTGTFSKIDLSMCDATLAPPLTWETLQHIYGLGHFPIKIMFPTNSLNQPRKIWNIKKVNWHGYKTAAKINTSDIPQNSNAEQIVQELTDHIHNAALEHIGYKTLCTKKNIPWWNKTCSETVKQLKKDLNKYKRTKTTEDLIQLKLSRAKTRRAIL